MAKNVVPHNLEAEKSVLGSMIASQRVCYDAVNLLDENDFYDTKANSVVFRAIKNLCDQEKTIDNASVANELQTNMKLLDQVGGVNYLAELQDYYIGDKHAAHHIKTVHDLSLVRKLFSRIHSLEKEFYEETISDVSDYIEKFDNSVAEITKNRASGEFRDTREVIQNISKDLKKKRGNSKDPFVVGVDTGYESLNKLTGGWQPGNLIILAARPSVGKTAFAINLIYNAATRAKKTVAFFSLEMSAEDIAKRLLASVSYVDSTNLKTGNLSDSDWMAIQEAENAINKTRILIDDTSGIKLGEIKTKVTKLKAQDPNLGLIVIDYLGLINVNNPKADHRQNIDEISRSLKGLARDVGLPIICLCQLSRANEKAARKPILSDLRDSGSIEQDADMVMFLYRENYQKQGKENADSHNEPVQNSQLGDMELTDVILAKNRNGQTGNLKLAFMMNIGKFTQIDLKGE